MTLTDLKARIAAEKAPAACTLERCACPTCAATTVLLRAMLIKRGVFRGDTLRVAIRAADYASASYPYLASVRVDDREVYRIHARPDEVFEPDVMRDIERALRRPM